MVATNTFYEHGSLVRSSVRPFVRFWLARDIANDELRTTYGGWGNSKSSQQPPPRRYHYSFSPTTTNNCPAAAQEDTVSYHLLIRSFLLLLQPVLSDARARPVRVPVPIIFLSLPTFPPLVERQAGFSFSFIIFLFPSATATFHVRLNTFIPLQCNFVLFLFFYLATSSTTGFVLIDAYW